MATSSVVPAKKFSADAYFQATEGFRVSADFTSLIVAAHPNPIIRRGLVPVEFTADVNGRSVAEVLKFLGGEDEVKGRSFTPDQLADMIDTHPNPSRGKSMTNLGTNLFFASGVNRKLFGVTLFFWHQTKLPLSVHAFELDPRMKFRGITRLFRNAVSRECLEKM